MPRGLRETSWLPLEEAAELTVFKQPLVQQEPFCYMI